MHITHGECQLKAPAIINLEVQSDFIHGTIGILDKQSPNLTITTTFLAYHSQTMHIRPREN